MEDRFDRIVTGASGTESVAIGLKPRLPFRFQRKLSQCLSRPVCHRGNTEWALLRGPGFRDIHSSHRLGVPIEPQVLTQSQPLLGSQ